MFIHEVDYIEKVQFEMHEFPEYLSLIGHQVFFYDFQEDKKSLDLFRSSDYVRYSRVFQNTTINLIHSRAFGSGILRRLSTFLFSYSDLKRICLDNHIDLIVLYSVPTFGLQTILIQKKLKTPFVFRALDISHKIRQTKLEYLIKKVEKLVYRNATHISTHNPSMVRYIISNLKSSRTISLELPPLDLDMFSKDIDTTILFKLRKNLGLSSNDKVIVYVGTLFHFVGLEEIFHELAKVPHELRAKLLIVGGGEQLALLKTLAEELNLSNSVIFTGFVDFGLIPGLLAISDVAINPLEPSLITHSALPNKVLQYIASGIQIVSTDLDGLKESFGYLSQIHWVGEHETVLSKALAMLLSNQNGYEEKSDLRNSDFERLFEGNKVYSEFEKMLSVHNK